MFLLSVENMVLLQYYSELQYNQCLDLFLLLLYSTADWKEDFVKLSASKIVKGDRLGHNNTCTFSRMLQRQDSCFVQYRQDLAAVPCFDGLKKPVSLLGKCKVANMEHWCQCSDQRCNCSPQIESLMGADLIIFKSALFKWLI